MTLEFNILEISVVIGAIMTITGFALGLFKFMKKKLQEVIQREMNIMMTMHENNQKKSYAWQQAQQKDINILFQKQHLEFEAVICYIRLGYNAGRKWILP